MQKSFVTSDGATLSYEDVGSGDCVVLLHGWSQSSAVFRHQVAHLSATRRVVALDFRGHGTSPPIGRGYRIHRFAADVAELMDRQDIERASVVGWSMGAAVLWAFIDLFGTARFDRLVMVDQPASILRQPGMTDDEATDAGSVIDAAGLAQLTGDILGPNGVAVRTGVLDRMVSQGIAPDLKAFLLAQSLTPEPRAVAALFTSLCTADWRDLLGRIDRPSLVIGGRVSHVDPRSQAWISRQVPGAELVVLEEAQGGSHFPFIERPDVFNAVVGRFLDGRSA